jgi:hypothetical protein
MLWGKMSIPKCCSKDQPTANMSLCFVKAFAEVGRRGAGIKENEYLKHAVAHLSGVRHPEDSESGSVAVLMKFEPWLASLRALALTGSYDDVEGKSSNGFYNSV